MKRSALSETVVPPRAKPRPKFSLLKFFVPAVCLILAASAGLSYVLLQFRIGRGDFKVFAEEKAGRFLNAKVRIGNIKIGFLNQIALSGLEIQGQAYAGHASGKPVGMGSSSPYLRVDQIVFRYNPLQLVTQNFQTPSRIVLKTPQLFLGQNEFPYTFLENLDFGSSGSKVSGIELVGGELRGKIPRLEKEFVMKDIHGTLEPFEKGRIRVDFAGMSRRILSGKVGVRGEIDLRHRTYLLKFHLDSVNLGEAVPSPVEALTGEVRWENGNFYFDELKARVHGWQSDLKGSLVHSTQGAEALLDWRVGKKDPLFGIHLQANLNTGALEGRWTPLGRRPWDFEGVLRKTGSRILLDPFKLDHRYTGHGAADFDTGDTEFHLEKNNQRLSLTTNMREREFTLRLLLDHAKFYGIDLTTLASVRLTSLNFGGEGRRWKFGGAFETDYFILEYAPFHDFRGSFEIDPAGIKNFTGTWGGVFRVQGSLLTRGAKPEEKLTVYVADLNLKQIQEFAAKPLPKELAGVLEGKLRLDGPIDHPEATGNFTIKSGRLGKLVFDRAMIHFRGFPPYLPLYDSRILKGRTKLRLQGAFDLRLKSILHGIEIQTEDKLVIWKGLEMNLGGAEKDLEIHSAISKLPTLALKAGEAKDRGAGEADAPPEEKYVAAGPKFRF